MLLVFSHYDSVLGDMMQGTAWNECIYSTSDGHVMYQIDLMKFN